MVVRAERIDDAVLKTLIDNPIPDGIRITSREADCEVFVSVARVAACVGMYEAEKAIPSLKALSRLTEVCIIVPPEENQEHASQVQAVVAHAMPNVSVSTAGGRE